MPGSDSTWDDQDETPGAFGHILERVSSQFTPNHNSQYQPGFVPAGAPIWTAPQSIDTTPYDNALLGNQAGLYPSRSYSVTQEPFPGDSHSPLNRSTSDLGIRLNDYAPRGYGPMGSIMQRPSVENLDGSAFYSNHPAQIQSSSIAAMSNMSPFRNTHTTGQNISAEHNLNQSYMSHNNTASSNFSAKISNFTASWGTWLSPFDHGGANNLDSSLGGPYSQSPSPSLDNYGVLSVSNEPLQQPSYIAHTPKTPVTSKPTYSDVLSMAPSMEKFNLNSNQVSQPKTNIRPHPHTRNRNETKHQLSHGKQHKNRNLNNIQARSNSPLINVNVASMNSSNASKSSPKQEVFSKVGLDEFDVPHISQLISQNSASHKHNLNTTPKNCNLEAVNKHNKKGENISVSSSPSHQPKKNKKDKHEESMDTLNKSSDQLNNHVLSNQKKQNLKKSAYINNVLNSPQMQNTSTSLKKNNSEVCGSNQTRKGVHAKEAKVDYDSTGSDTVVKKDTTTTNSSFNHKDTEVSARSNSTTSRNYRSNKSDRNKETTKKQTTKKKKLETPNDHSELLLSIWSYLVLWSGHVAKAAAWLFMITLEVVHMSFRLFVRFSREAWDSGCIYWYEMKKALLAYGTSALNYFSRKKENVSGQSDRRLPSGLETNIPLPATGEAAMKRLLAGKGKDPYSILGVTRHCTDEDIKKYYKRQAFLVHPDKNKQPGAEEAFKILAHAFELIGEPERRAQYDTKLSEEVQLEGAWGELSSLMSRLREKLEEAANTIRCTNCNRRHKRLKQERPVYGARYCAECQLKHAAREGDIWAESTLLGLRWRYFACMDGAIYDISEWAGCQKENLKHLQANIHSVQYRIVSGKKSSPGKNPAPECPTEPELEEFFNNLCRERYDYGSSTQSDARKKKTKKRK